MSAEEGERWGFYNMLVEPDDLLDHALVLAWMDLEMTGLDPGRNVIVEIATLVTDDELEILDDGPTSLAYATVPK